MRPSSFLVLAVLFVLGVLVGQAAVRGVPYGGQQVEHVMAKGQGSYPAKGSHPAKGPVQQPQKVPSKPGSCPRVLMRCAMMNPPNACMRDSECNGNKKCCMGSCGRICTRPRMRN
ncbi:elafin [Pipistrellus kuhlii]|uniref:Peptidase inhibitor 3 n=1 Tax=Pipistrellus kuhlii TaxID=59472 RepID=A0A7J7Y9Z4_PIPKU|nr:elafin [Pipistrellus kuhlii]KAF6358769.1 peptidase inhibitor 3 [Pipistrellus kuhlii]